MNRFRVSWRIVLILCFVNALLGSEILRAQPTISEVAPNRARPTTSVIISGTNFNTVAGNNIVFFGATRGTVTAASSTSLTVTVDTGAISAPISVLNTGTDLTGYEDSAFVPIYVNSYFIPSGINFKPKVDFAAGTKPYVAAIGDIDGDGKPDLVVNNKNDNNIYIYRNTSTPGVIDGSSFASPVSFSTGNQPVNVKLADLDGDGKLDVIVSDVGIYSISVFKNTSVAGSISLAARVNFVTTPSGSAPTVITIADFDKDGWPDIATSTSLTNNITIFRNAGTPGIISAATFEAAAYFSVGTAPVGITTADVDGDGMMDIITADSGAYTVSVLRNTITAAGSFSASSFATAVAFATAAEPVDVVAGDIDGDGKPEILVTCNAANKLSVLHNTSISGSVTFGAHVDFATSSYPTGIALADIDGDGKLDVAVTNVSPLGTIYNVVSVFRNSSTYGAITSSSFSAGGYYGAGLFPFGLTIGDLDGDGYPDMVTGNYISNSISVIRNYPLPYVAPISGDTAICVTDVAVPFSDTTTGGTWSMSNNAVATISAGGTVTPHMPGMDTVFYRIVAGGDTNYAYRLLLVDTAAVVSAIAGPSVVCVGLNITLTDTANGGTWNTTGSPFIATLSATGVVTGTGSGTFPVTYTKSNNCNTATATTSVTVYPTAPNAGTISGSSTMCAGADVTLSETSSSGTWSASNGHATVSSAGVVHGLSGGTDTIRYTVTNICASATATYVMTISPLPNAGTIAGPGGVCVGNTITLSDAVSGGTWTAANANASVSTSGVVTGNSVGGDTILYSVSNACGGSSAQKIIGVINTGAGVPIAGSPTVCVGATATLTDAAGGGTWASTNTLVASIDPSTGVVTGNNVGTDTIVYTVTYTCGPVISSYVISVTTAPVAGSITGADSVCSGASIVLSDAAGSGSWSSYNTAVATVTTSGIVTGGSTADTVSMIYTVSNSCGTVHASKIIKVNPLAEAGAITGTTTVCQGGTTTLSDTATGGTWSSSDITHATVSSAGIVSVSGTGVDTIFYSVSNSCGNTQTYAVLNINALPSAGSISGAASVCVAATTPLSESAGGGIWSSFNTALATVNSSGVVSGQSAGTDTIYYTVSNTCGTARTNKVIIVNPLANPGNIAGSTDVCVGGSQMLAESIFGGTWSSQNLLIATVSSTGTVTGISEGLVNISYSVTNGCGTQSTFVTFNVAPVPDAGAIAGTSFVCIGSSVALTDTAAGGTWAASNGFANVAAGVVTGVTTGTDTISYTIANSCGSATVTKNITVKGGPSIGAITGPANVCAGASVALADTSDGGIWSISSGTASNATITAAGVVTGITAGSAVVIYSISDSFCAATATDTLTIKPLPVLSTPLSPTAVCDNTAFVYIPASATTGATYTWTRATAAGISNAAGSGADSIHETLDNTTSNPVTAVYKYVISAGGCIDTQNVSVVVNPTPALSGSLFDTVCSGSAFTYLAGSLTTGASFTWTRPAVAGVSPATASGTGNLSETLTNISGSSINVVYIYTVSANGCSRVQDVTLTLTPQAPVPHITTKPSSMLCDHVMYQNFGAATPPPVGSQYQWSTANGATIWATGADKQYCLINFANPGGIAWVYLNAAIGGNTCNSKDSFAVYISTNEADMPDIIRFGNDFVCQPNNMDTYQWGYDDAATLDSTIFTGETNQSYHNTHPDSNNKYYWVITTRNECMQKTYYNAPTGVRNIAVSTGKLILSPNPNNGIFTIWIPSVSGGKAKLIITNTLGQILKEQSIDCNKDLEIQLDVAPGVYYVNTITREGQLSTKVVVTR